MSLSIAGINLADSAINAEYRISVLERVIDRLLRTAPPGTLNDAEMATIRAEVMAAL